MPLFSHHGDIPDNSAALSLPSLVFAVLTPIVVASRLLGRYVLSGRIGVDDWTILASCVLCKWAFGKHKDDIVSEELLARTLKLYFIAQLLYKINLGLTKISILLLYVRLFIQRWFRFTCWTWISVILAFTIGTVFSSIFQCSPVQYAFNKSVPGGTCINMTAFWYANAAFNILSDLVIIVLPVPVISNLQLPLKSKVALCGIFAVGIFVCITSILRITTLDIATSHLDITWNSIGSSMWTIIESNIGIICACLPALHRPLVFTFPRLFGKLQRSWAYGVSNRSREGRGKPVVADSVPKKMAGWSVLDESATTSEEGGTTLSQSQEQEKGQIELSQMKSEIRKTTQVVVQVEGRGEGDIEMDGAERHRRNVGDMS
ncbi:hypothetical protein BDV23DRAFT_177019 [Aspergillus alliaceus]|uniref:Rhodopsin domain-containing protein n=1 Tax=Petromyces alliaceus TaxID=209559 RepID=A0A5N7BRV2_PETAA|nr:hypothetical protein BDV23DRAFT_177019 [Aspergillus alliaceus]